MALLIKNLIPAKQRRVVGRRIRNLRRGDDLTFGLNFLAEVRSRLPGLSMDTIFDVGAHIGLTELQFADEFPKAEIYAFEPGTENMKRLVANLVGKPGVKRIKSGLGAAVSTQRLIVDAAHPSMARISDMRTALLRASKLTRSTLSA
jgi:hypothetical protein